MQRKIQLEVTIEGFGLLGSAAQKIQTTAISSAELTYSSVFQS